MAWTRFSAEAVRLHGLVARLDKQGRISDALEAIKAALEKAYTDGPSGMSYEDFEKENEARQAAK